MSEISPLPCNRGIPNNVLGRGYHHFQASPNGVVVCIYCGRKPNWAAPDRPMTTWGQGVTS
jgi:hypothetical protein